MEAKKQKFLKLVETARETKVFCFRVKRYNHFFLVQADNVRLLEEIKRLQLSTNS